MKTAGLVHIVLICMLCVLSGCQKVQTQKRVNNFDKSMTSYEIALRWAMYEDALSYHVSPEGEQPEVDLEAVKAFSVTRINIAEKLMNGDQDEAYVRIIVDYYQEETGVVRTVKLEQYWWYNEDLRQWFTKSDFPDFK